VIRGSPATLKCWYAKADVSSEVTVDWYISGTTKVWHYSRGVTNEAESNYQEMLSLSDSAEESTDYSEHSIIVNSATETHQYQCRVKVQEGSVWREGKVDIFVVVQGKDRHV
jgi:hypothetical protein